MSNVVSTTASATAVYPAGGDRSFAQLQYDVAVFYGMQNDSSKLALAGRIMNDIIDDLNRKQVWMFNVVTSSTIQTSQGVPTVSLPSDFWKVYNSRKTDAIDFTLDAVRQTTFDTRFQAQFNITGYPYCFVIKNTYRDGTVRLFPTPDSTYDIQIRYFKLIGRLTTPDSTLDLPRPYQPLIMYGARAQFGALNEKPDLAAYWDRKFEASYQEMKAADEFDGDENLRFMNVEEGMNPSYLSPNIRPRAYDLY